MLDEPKRVFRDENGNEIKVVDALHPQKGVPKEYLEEIWYMSPEDEQRAKERNEKDREDFRNGKWRCERTCL